MPITPDQALAIKVKRWERILHRAAITLAILVTVVMIFVLARLIKQRVDDRKNAIAADAGQQADFHTNVVSGGALDSALGKSGKQPLPRKVDPVDNFVDLSSRKLPLREAGRGQEERKPNVESENTGQTGTAIENLSQKQVEIEKLTKEFFEANRITEMLPLVRDARRVRPLMEDYYNRNPIKQSFWRGVSWIKPISEPGYRFAFVEVMFDNTLPLQVVVEETRSGFLLDWESSVQYSEMGWKEFLHDRPDQPKMFRVIANKPDGAPDDPEDGQVTMLKISHPHEPGTVKAHFDYRNPRFAALINQMKLNHWKDVPVTLRIYFPDTNAVSNEVQISGVAGKGWLILDNP